MRDIKKDLEEIQKDIEHFLNFLEEGVEDAFKFFMHDSINLQSCIVCLMQEDELLGLLREKWEIPAALAEVDKEKAKEVIKYLRASLEDIRVAVNQMRHEVEKIQL